MKHVKVLTAFVCTVAFLTAPTVASAKTCCQKAADEGKQCTHKCCVSAHRGGKSCEKCNPNKEDLKLKKSEKKSEKSTEKSAKKTPSAQS